MAVRSMTGFGRAETTGEQIAVVVEARSVNHRHLDVSLRVPRALTAVEADARRLVQSRVERGRVDVTILVTAAPGRSGQRVAADAALAAEYLERAREIGAATGLARDLTLGWLLERPGVLRLEEVEAPTVEAVWPLVAEALDQALDLLIAHRAAEGAALAAELRALHAALEGHVAAMAARAPAAQERRATRFRERLQALLGSTPVDEARLLTEVAVWADRADVREELTRLGAHLQAFLDTLDKGGAIGRALDFLIQELHREVNTLGAKADDLELGQAALAAKGTIEKMREQVQNLE